MVPRRIGSRPLLLFLCTAVIVGSARPAASQALVVMVPAGGGAAWDGLWTRPGHSKGVYLYVGVGDPAIRT